MEIYSKIGQQLCSWAYEPDLDLRKAKRIFKAACIIELRSRSCYGKPARRAPFTPPPHGPCKKGGI